jgi:hypothetical protein
VPKQKLLASLTELDSWNPLVIDHFKSQPKYFWKYVPSFRRLDRTICLNLGMLVMALTNITLVQGPPFPSHHNQFASLPPVPPSEYLVSHQTTRTNLSRLMASIQRCSEIFFRTGSNLNLLQKHFPILWKRPPIFSAFKNVTSSVSNYRPISILNTFFQWPRFAPHPSPIRSERQVVAIYFDLSSAFGLAVTRCLITSVVLSGGYVTSPTDNSRFQFHGLLSDFRCSTTTLFWGNSFPTHSLITLWYAIMYSEYVLFAGNIKIVYITEHPNDCSLSQTNTDYTRIQGWCTANFMKPN